MGRTITMDMRGRPVAHDEAMKSAHRLINSHFHNKDSARCSIPARYDDDDITVIDYILEQQIAAKPSATDCAVDHNEVVCAHPGCTGPYNCKERGLDLV